MMQGKLTALLVQHLTNRPLVYLTENPAREPGGVFCFRPQDAKLLARA